MNRQTRTRINPDTARVRQLREYVAADVNDNGRIAYLDPLVRETLVDQISEHAFAKYHDAQLRARQLLFDVIATVVLLASSIGAVIVITAAYGAEPGLYALGIVLAMTLAAHFAYRPVPRKQKIQRSA